MRSTPLKLLVLLALLVAAYFLSPSVNEELDLSKGKAGRGLEEAEDGEAIDPVDPRPIVLPPPPADDEDVGTLLLRFHAHESPVAGIGVAIEPRTQPRLSPKTMIALGTSTGDGTLRIRLREGTYRWRLTTRDFVTFVPEAEASRPTHVPLARGARRGWQPRSGACGPANRLSGPFTIEAGKETAYTVPVHRGAGIRGALSRAITGVDRAHSPPSNIALHFVEHLEHPDPQGPSMTTYPLMGERAADADGRFKFANIPPGDYLLRAWWRDERFRYALAQAKVHVPEGEMIDAGTLAPIDGDVLSFALRVPPTPLVTGPAAPPRSPWTPKIARIVLATDSTRIPRIHDLALGLQIPVGRELSFQGLASGYPWHIRLMDQEPLTLDDGSRLVPSSAEANLVPNETRTIDFVKPRVVRRNVHLVLHCDEPVRAHVAFSRERDREFLGRKEVHPREWKDGIAKLSAALPEGPCRVLVHTQRASRLDPTPSGHYALASFIAPRAKLELRLARGIDVHATVESPNGDRMTNQLMSFRPVGWPAWVFSAKTNGQGELTLHGLPPDLEIEGMKIRGRFSTAQPLRGLRLVRER